MYLLIAKEKLKSHIPQNTYFYPANITVFFNTFENVKRLCSEISEIKVLILEGINDANSTIGVNDQLKYITNFMVKKRELFKICSLLKKTEYWGYTPLQVLLTWMMGAILEDEWTWSNLLNEMIRKKLYTFNSYSQFKDITNYKKRATGKLEDEILFQKDYEAVYIKIDTMMSEITKKLTELEQTQTDRSRFKNNKNRENKALKLIT